MNPTSSGSDVIRPASEPDVKTQAPRKFFGHFAGLLLSQILAAALVTWSVDGWTRITLSLFVIPVVTMMCSTRMKHSRFLGSLAIVLATLLSLALVYGLRQQLEPSWLLGPIPPSLDVLAYFSLATLTILAGILVFFAFSSAGLVHRVRWPITIVLVGSLVGFAVVLRQSVREPSPSSLLQTIAVLEQMDERDSNVRQQLCDVLAMCGRDADAESNTRSWFGDPSKESLTDVQELNLRPQPWREKLSEIAQQETLVLLMEAHHSPIHRQWIEQALDVLHQAGFRDYAAEGLAESGTTLTVRGYPAFTSGYYVADPHFGNVIRTALRLDFNLHSYESYGTDFQQREYEQAVQLAKLLEEAPQKKLVVHAGYGHVHKKADAGGYKAMAAHLWDMTGIEPYCILQTWHSPDDPQARQLAALLPDTQEPMLLVPAPSGLTDTQFRYATGAVDALVVHAPSTGGPANRKHSFPEQRERVVGRWHGSEWPVIIGAYKNGEPSNAVAVDQVMLREGENDFVLWVPFDETNIRAHGVDGPIQPTLPDGSPRWTIDTMLR